MENNENGYYFPWLETKITISDSSEQSWDSISILFDLPKLWEINNTDILHVEDESEITIGIKPPINAKEGESRIPFTIVNGYGLTAGYGNVSVTIPQYYGVSIAAQQINSDVKILVTNTGNGKDTFRLSKELDEGLTLYLEETYFELEAGELKEINTQGLETKSTLKYEATFEVESIGNTNISANVVLEIKGISISDSEDSAISNGILVSIIIGITISALWIRARRI